MQNKNLLVFTLASVGILVGWQLFMAWLYPPPVRPKPPSQAKTWPFDRPPQERQQALGTLALASAAGSGLQSPAALAMPAMLFAEHLEQPQRWPFGGRSPKEQERIEARLLVAALAAGGAWNGLGQLTLEAALAKRLPPPSTDPKPEVIELGGAAGWFLRARLTNEGAAVRQVVLNDFQEADIYGLPVPDQSDPTKPMPLELVPEKRIRMRTELTEPPDHEIKTDDTPEGRLDHYQLFDYPNPEAENPVDTLGKLTWRVAARKNDPAAEQHEVSFTADVRDRVRITKTFTLNRKDYHIGLSIKVQSLIADKADQHKFRYQLAGARGLPIEGAWYTYTFRNALVGWGDLKGGAHRHLEDSRQIAYWMGGDEHRREQDKTTIRYAGVAIQFFAAVVAIAEKENQPGGRDDFIKSVRATHEGKPNPQMPFFDDITVRLMSEPLLLEPGSPSQPGAAVEHNYLLYHGPVKVKLLRYLKGDRAVAAELVDRYEDALQLKTLTDHHSPGMMGKFADTIGMTWLVIKFTNVMHWLLHKLNWVVPIFGLNIIMLTLMVRGLMFPISRRQAMANQKMQEKMGKLAPEVKKLQEKYKDDPMALNQARNQLYMENGINPLNAMGGCLLIFAQMPVFLGLYYALQESIFFRLNSFLWMPNLAAPDMLIWWSEKIPMISDPNGLGNMFYLGPYFNLLPGIAVALMLLHQIAVAPPPTDEQQAMQMKMMKWMTVFFGFMFYKVAAGLSIYFIASSIWGLAERKLLPKSKPGAGGGTESDSEPARLKPDPRKPDARKQKLESKKDAEPNGLKQKLNNWWQDVLKEASKQQQARNTDDRGKKKR